MKAEILSTGNELVSGSISDTNASWLAAMLLTIGVETRRCMAVGDDLEAIGGAIAEMAVRADILLVTGGLGPTGDDLTAEAAAMAFGKKLVLNSSALEAMERFFLTRGWEMGGVNQKQAMIPLGCEVIENHAGTAPGFYFLFSGCHCFFMPGVPSEMKSMAEKTIFPAIINIAGHPVMVKPRSITLFGLPEAEAGLILKDLEISFPGVRLGFRVDFPLIEVKLSLKEQRVENGESLLDRAQEFVVSCLGSSVISTHGLTMEQEVGRLLLSLNATVAAAESCTGGLLASMLTDVAGSSGYFLFSAVTYSNEAKTGVLGVLPSTIIDHGAVSRQTARQMAEGVKKLTGAAFGVSTSGIAGPGGGSDEKPVGMVCIGIAGPGFSTARDYRFSFDDRAMNKKIFAVMALDLLRQRLISEKGSF